MTGRELRDARKLLGWTQHTLGQTLGITGKHIGDMERGNASIEKRTVLSVRYLLLVRPR